LYVPRQLGAPWLGTGEADTSCLGGPYEDHLQEEYMAKVEETMIRDFVLVPPLVSIIELDHKRRD
jgi:hypothetical protein